MEHAHPPFTEFFRRASLDDEPDWLSAVLLGEWERIPEDLDYSASGPLACLIDGYKVARMLGAEDAGDVACAAGARYDAASQTWAGSAVELWVTLFYMHRADHFTAYIVPVHPPADYPPPDPTPPRPELDALCQALRAALIGGRHWPEQ